MQALDLEQLKDYLLQKGYSEEELNDIVEAPVVRDIGKGLLLLLENGDNMGKTLSILMKNISKLTMKVTELEKEVALLKTNGGKS